MTTINTKLIRDGNSVAVRIPKTVLAMSGLRDGVQMEVRKGQITLRPTQMSRVGWKEKIDQVKVNNPTASTVDSELEAWNVTDNDGLNELL